MKRTAENYYLVTCDPARTHDFCAISILYMYFDNNIGDFRYVVQEMDRIRGMEYPVIENVIIGAVNKLGDMKDGPHGEQNSGPHICVDANGLGDVLVSYLSQHKRAWNGGGGFRNGRMIFPVVTTGGENGRMDYNTGRLFAPKSQMVGVLDSLSKHGRLSFRGDLELYPEFLKELDAFKYQTTNSNHLTFNAEGNEHDDLISSIYIGLHVGENVINSASQHGVRRVSDHGAADLDMRLPPSFGTGFMQGGHQPGSQ